MIGPVAATPVNPLPEIAPITAHTIIATVPSPDLICPINESAQSRSRLAIPLPPIYVPARINSGLARRTVPVDWENTHTSIVFMDTFPNALKNISAPKKHTGRGILIISKNTRSITSSKIISKAFSIITATPPSFLPLFCYMLSNLL